MNCKLCQNSSGKNSSISFFRFPSNYNRCREWAERCNILNVFDKFGPTKFYKSFRICSDHFDRKYITFDGRKKKLFSNAVPNAAKPGKKVKRKKMPESLRADADVRVTQKLLENLCRFCAEENTELTDIFSWRGETLELEKKIKVFPIVVKKRDNLPLKICNPCIVKISKFYDFVRNCLKADIRLKTILGIAPDARSSDVLMSEGPAEILGKVKDDLNVNDYKEDSRKSLESNVFLFLKSDEITQQEDGPRDMEYPTGKDEGEGCTSQLDNFLNTADTVLAYITSEEHILLNKSNDVLGKKISVSSEGNKSWDRYICNICSKTFNALEILESHWKAHSLQPDEHGRFICRKCNRHFPNKYRLNEHNRVHTGEYPFKCTVCDKKFHKMALLKQHSVVHESIKRFICSVCDLRSSRKGNLIQHLRTHYRNTKKENCNSFSLSSGNGVQLVNSINFEIDKTENIKLENQLGSNGTCNGMPFPDGETFEQHIRSENTFSEPRFRNVNDEPMHQSCNDDREVFDRMNEKPNTLRKRPHQRIYQCKECGVRFKRKDTLTNHMRIHTGERPFVCGSCGFAFKQKGDCLKHERNHQKRKLFHTEN